MSIQYGRWNFDSRPISQEYLAQIQSAMAAYGPDGGNCYSDTHATLLYRAFHTTAESRREFQPFRSASGNVLTWDGRLDNRAELITALRGVAPADPTDLQLVACAYDSWNTDCFARLLGDWAVAVWNPQSRSLTLAKDPVGIRGLYYWIGRDHIVWCSLIDPIVAEQNTDRLCEEYAAGWMAFFPAAYLTPYEGIFAVPPASFVSLTPTHKETRKYWDFNSGMQIRYRSDADYEDHFRAVFTEAVRRRLRSDSPILCELSGGMDSSSIVCVADRIFASAHTDTPRIDTISYYDDSEPNWNERQYFSKVEEKRGRAGWHIDVGTEELGRIALDCDEFTSLPGMNGKKSSVAGQQLSACISSQRNRVLLSGVGGDEVTGGVPTCVPELQNYMARANFASLARQLKAWALQKRKPWIYLFWESMREFLPAILAGAPQETRPASWLLPEFVSRNKAALDGYRRRIRFFGALPSFRGNLVTLEYLRRQLACDIPGCEPLCERRCPFLDRTFLEFMFAIPREQVIRPGQRRSLMRRALSGIVPDEILSRKRKAFVMRRPMAALSRQLPELLAFSEKMVTAALGIVDANQFRETVTRGSQGKEIPTVKVLRTLEIERWLRGRMRSIQLNAPRKEESLFHFPETEALQSRGPRGLTGERVVVFQPDG